MDSELIQKELYLSPIIAGVWKMSEWNWSIQERQAYIEHCIELGITSFDHADIYGDYRCEFLFGQALKQMNLAREEFQIVSKCGIKLLSKQHPEIQVKHYDTSYAHIIESVENSLVNLNVDYLDCVLIHRPDPLMQCEEVARAFSDLLAKGKIKSAGVSNFKPHQLSMLQSFCDFRLVTNQVEISLLQDECINDGTLSLSQQYQTSVMAWSPLAGGRIFNERQNSDLLAELASVAKESGVTPATVALAWLMKLPVKLHPIIGTGNSVRISELVKATQLNLNTTQWFKLYKAAKGSDVA
ncbi:MAG: aldo/keto reductase [Kangiellaceae bacterium]|nr:aldo/keto reductase [Kangiellaceae bacterium]MCW8998499.1 aldo/keto reductase [Kangiellaceae bacterium]